MNDISFRIYRRKANLRREFKQEKSGREKTHHMALLDECLRWNEREQSIKAFQLVAGTWRDADAGEGRSSGFCKSLWDIQMVVLYWSFHLSELISIYLFICCAHFRHSWHYSVGLSSICLVFCRYSCQVISPRLWPISTQCSRRNWLSSRYRYSSLK